MKNIIKYLKASTLLTAFCGLFSLGCLTLEHTQKKAERVSAFSYCDGITMSGANHDTVSGYETSLFKGEFENSEVLSVYNESQVNNYTVSGSYTLNFYMNYTTLLCDYSVNIGTISYNYKNSSNQWVNRSFTPSVTTFSYQGITVGNNISIANFYFSLLDITNITQNQYYIRLEINFYNSINWSSLYTYNSNLTFGTPSGSSELFGLGNFKSSVRHEQVRAKLLADTYRDYGISEYNLGYSDGVAGTEETAYENGYNAGRSDGWKAGVEQGMEATERDYNTGYVAGYNQAEAELTTFYESAQTSIYDHGYRDGYTYGFNDGEDSMQEEIHEANINSYNEGYVDGYNNASTQDSTVATIFSGILQVALVPVNFFLAIFNFEILGINLSGFIRALFTVALTIIIIKTIFGGKGASE